MRLIEGDNHLISERDGLVICQVWVRPDLSTEDGAKNAGQMVAYLTDAILRTGTPYRGIVFDVRRGPKVFGPQTRTVMERLLALSASRKVRVAIIASDSATKVLQFTRKHRTKRDTVATLLHRTQILAFAGKVDPVHAGRRATVRRSAELERVDHAGEVRVDIRAGVAGDRHA